MARYIDIDDFRKNAYYADTDLDIGVYLAEHGCADVVPKSEVDKLEYTLTGVMHSVDKWLDGDELEQDEVNRAITMREKTLRIIEELALKNHQLKEENEYLQSVVDGLDDFVLQVKQEVAREIFKEIEKLAYRFMNDNHYIFPDMVWDIDELKKKYAESEDKE